MEHHRLSCIIGAARSGTKLLRDLLGRHPDVAVVPYDINYVWRWGIHDERSDELSREDATAENRERIAGALSKYSRGRAVLVEKTVGNALRPAFVDELFPEARFVHLLRDGRDVVESAVRQWRHPPGGLYLLRKFLSAPPPDWRYALRYLRDTALRRRGEAPVWGPRYRGVEEHLRRGDLLEVCATQWRRCVEVSRVQLAELAPGRVLEVRYEDLVEDPGRALAEVFRFLGVDPAPSTPVPGRVSRENVGKGSSVLASEDLARLEEWLGPTLVELGYESNPNPAEIEECETNS